nr:C2 calcium lipid binding region CaLB [Hymenolepis microstoma]
MPLFCSKKGDTPVEPGPNPFKPPMILNIHMKYDERIQTLEVLVRNLQNSPRGEKVKVVGRFVERSACDRRKKPGFIGRVIRREKTDEEGYTINSHSTSAKAGPNPHYNTKFPFGKLIRCDVHCGKLVFEIIGTSWNKTKSLGCVEMDGSEIQIDRDTAYSLYVRDPICNPPMAPVDVVDGVCRTGALSQSSSTGPGKTTVCYPTNTVVCDQGQNGEIHAAREFECFQERGSSCSPSVSSSSRCDHTDESGTVLYEIVKGLGRKRAYSTSDCDSISVSSSSSSSCSDDSDITIYEIVQVDPCKASSLQEDKKCKTETCDSCCGTAQNQVVVIGDNDSSIDECAMILRSNIQYNDRQQKLTVFIRNLGIVDDKSPHIVKCVLYTADGRRLERKTSKKYGINPYFNQELVFSKLVQADVRGGHLLFTVSEKKRCGKNVVGMGIIPGSRINLCRDEAYNTAIVQQYCSTIPRKFIYNPRDVNTEPDNLVRVVYPEAQKHIEVYN